MGKKVELLLPTQLLALIVSCCVLSETGCVVIAHVSINDPISHEKVEFIQEGRTTFKDVIEELGLPSRLVGLKEGGAIAAYQFLDIKYARVNYGWLLQFLPQSRGQNVDMILAGGGLGTDMFEVTFDEHWVAKNYVFAKHAQASRYVFWPF